MHFSKFGLVVCLLLGLGAAAHAQPLEVTFRYPVPPGGDAVRVFFPGEFNNWGPNSSGVIAPGAVSEAMFVDSLGAWIYPVTLLVGQTYQYKIHFHFNASGSDWEWITDPNNPISNPADNNNSVVTVADPMVFQLVRELNEEGLIEAVSAGVCGTDEITSLSFEVNGVAQEGLPFFNPATGVFRYELPQPIRAGSQFKVTATDAAARVAEAEVGEILLPVAWVTPAFPTYGEMATVVGSVTRQDGTVDPGLTEATLIVNGEEQTVDVVDGIVRANVMLARGENELLLRAEIEGETVTSEPLVVTRRPHPLNDILADVEVTGSGLEFSIRLTPRGEAVPPNNTEVSWDFDEEASTTTLASALSFSLDQLGVGGTVTGPGVLFFDIELMDDGGLEDFLRVAVVFEADGTVRAMRYEETPAWVDQAVVYEIFPLSFGPTEASGTAQNPGRRLDEITEELDYIAQMGFTVLWFMPIFANQFMDQLSGGYNIVDFYEVDPKLGTNEDFKALVERAHALGLKVILDITPNHVSPIHPWVDSVRDLGEGSPFFDYLQTTPSPHNRGLDNRGPNLPEIWQSEGGVNLYRKYDGFGDLANLDWDDDDLQAALLDVFKFWVREFDIDGWRFDVYWGPWRRYGPERFGRPIRELMKRLKPDTWLLGEIAGTGVSTEVYYTDDDFGNSVVGGIDAGYDWNFYFNAVRGNYADLGAYDFFAHNGDFYPGPNARYFRFLENHDEERIAKLFRNTPLRILPLTGFLLTTTGVPMVYQGQEVGFGNVSGDARRRPVTWETPENDLFAPYYQELAHARTRFPAFGTQDLVTIHTANSVYAYVRPFPDENAVVLVNFAGEPRTVTINPTGALIPQIDGPVMYTDIFADTTFTDPDGFTVTLPAYDTVVFITGEAPNFVVPELPDLPFGAVLTGVERVDGEKPDAFRLAQNYPNPFNPVTTIAFDLPEAGPVRLTVFDLLGRRVALLLDGMQPAGRYEALFDASALPSGTYLYRLEAGGRVQVRKMLLVK